MMRKGMTCALVVLAASAGRAFGITAYSAGDSSLAGVTVAEVDGGYLYPIGGTPPVGPVPPYAMVDERVVRNGGGTLDFYYRFSAVAGVPLAVNWVELQMLPLSTRLGLGYLADSGGQLPTDGATGPASFGFADLPEWQYAAFGFGSGGQAVAFDETGSAWLLLRTDATTYQQGFVFFVDEPVDFFPVGGVAPGVGGVPEVSAPIYVPGGGGGVAGAVLVGADDAGSGGEVFAEGTACGHLVMGRVRGLTSGAAIDLCAINVSPESVGPSGLDTTFSLIRWPYGHRYQMSAAHSGLRTPRPEGRD